MLSALYRLPVRLILTLTMCVSRLKHQYDRGLKLRPYLSVKPANMFLVVIGRMSIYLKRISYREQIEGPSYAGRGDTGKADNGTETGLDEVSMGGTTD